ncbi:MAG: transposase [Bacteroidia bacterium]|nr:transposase [Bacteroidia bacterium]
MKIEPILPGSYYHIYNQGVNRENIFFEEMNYGYFLKLYEKYISTIADTYAYCLMPNHFHLLVKIKDIDIKSQDYPQAILRISSTNSQFSKFFNSYAKSINKSYNRTGSLFIHPFKRKKINSEKYLIQLIIYIHFNPQNHGFENDFRNYTYSSYHKIVRQDNTFIAGEKVLEWFDGIDNFIDCHRIQRPLNP